MNIIKKVLLVMILLLVVVVFWVGSTIYFKVQDVSIDPNASSYTKPLRETFNTEELDLVIERSNEGFPITPEEFFQLNQD